MNANTAPAMIAKNDAILRFPDYGRETEFHADVVVVGTGAGGAVVGAELAEAGLAVAFVEEGGWHDTSSFNPYLAESLPRLYRDAGVSAILGTPNIPFAEGRCVGGSTTINGGMTWRTPDDVLAGWQASTGAPELGPEGMAPYFERIEERISAKHHLDLAIGGDARIMVQGARKMGWRVEVNRRNQETCVGTNNCVMGCPTGAKQSTLVTYMPRAMKAGARCLTEVRIEELIIENGRCVGVRGRAIDPRTRKPGVWVRVRAKAVVIACGAIQTPALLLKHKLGRPSGLLGNNLTCHPNVKVMALYPFDVRSWQGMSQYAQVREFHDDGIVLAENFIPPGLLAAHLPFHGAEAWELMRRYDQIVLSGALVEDSTTGTVRRGPMGMAVARYDITAKDHARFLKGARLLAEMHFAMGAEQVFLPFSNLPSVRSVDELARIAVTQTKFSTLELFTVHMMGTASMGSDARRSVIDLSGQIWDLPGCYVADASIFPTAIGVNPQVTIMAMATRIAERLAEGLTEGLGKARRAGQAAGVHLSA